MPIRIAIDGPQSSGKTTLWEDLQPTFESQLSFIPEAARIIAPRFGVKKESDWPGLLRDPSALEEFFLAEEQWLQEKERRATNGCIVDSSFFMIEAYRKLLDRRARNRPQLVDEDHYALIIYCIPPPQATADGFRFLAGREKMEQAYEAVLPSAARKRMSTLAPTASRHREASSIIENILNEGPIGSRVRP